MSQRYLDAVYQGQNEWWRYLLGIIIIIFCGFFWGSILAGVVAVVWLFLTNPDPTILQDPDQLNQALMQFMAQYSVGNFIIQNLPFLALLLGIGLTVKLIHRRPLRSLISPSAQFSYRRFFTGYGLWLSLLLILLGVSYGLEPDDFTLTFSPAKWLLLLLATVLLTPIQIAAEELFCRGYLMQGLGLVTRNRLVLMSLPSLLFALGHFSNPEMARGAVWMALQYWALGVFLALLTLRDNRLELALGIHAAQNMFVLLLVNTADSVLPTPSILTLKDTGDPRFSLIWLLIQSGVFYWLIFGRPARRMSKL